VVTVEDGVADGGVGSLIAAGLTACCAGRTKPRVEILGVPLQFIPHGKPDRILANLGLDGEGIARHIAAALTRTPD
jgi:1-deoxy-D-xylulose-5-phosphate synthase